MSHVVYTRVILAGALVYCIYFVKEQVLKEHQDLEILIEGRLQGILGRQGDMRKCLIDEVRR